MLFQLFMVAVGGSLGAMLRYGIALASNHWWGATFPWGTLVANLTGCFVMGVLLGTGVQKNLETHYLLFGVGVLGALTTFSTFSAETVQLAVEGQWTATGINVFVSTAGCLAACFVGLQLSRMWAGS